MDNDAEKPAEKTDTRRVNVNFSPETYEALVRLAKSQGISLSDALRQSITLSDYIVSTDKDPDSRILIDRKGQVNELKLIR